MHLVTYLWDDPRSLTTFVTTLHFTTYKYKIRCVRQNLKCIAIGLSYIV